MLVLDANAIAQLATPSGADDPAIGYGLNRLAVLGDQVDAHVRPVFVQDRMIAVKGEAGRDVLEIERELQRLRTERVALFVGERDSCQRAAAKADLGGLHVADQRVRAVAADLLLVNQLYG